VKTIECPRESDVLEAVILDRWSDELRQHADGCAVCRDLAMVATVFHDEREDAWREARLPTSGQVWWRASTRARAEAAATAARPITMLQGLAGACAAGVSAAVITLGWPSTQMQAPLTSIAEIVTRGSQRLGAAALSAGTLEQAALSVAVVLGAAVMLAPFVVYLLLSEE
jgi:hypothetical protein